MGAAYVYVYTHHCLYPLPWDSPLTWLVAAVGIDFCYYWVHRAAHGNSYLSIYTRISRMTKVPQIQLIS